MYPPSHADHGSFIAKQSRFSGRKFFLAMEYADDGDLLQLINNKRKAGQGFDEEEILSILVQCLIALKYIHNKRIIHRDIKSANIFLTGQRIVKVGDFGISRVLANTLERAGTMIGTPYYLSPEVIRSKPYGYKTDVWSLGIVLYEMCTLKHAFNADDMYGLISSILNGNIEPIPRKYSTELSDIVHAMLNKDPQARPTVSELIRFPYLTRFLTKLAKTAESFGDLGAPKSSESRKPRKKSSFAIMSREESLRMERGTPSKRSPRVQKQRYSIAEDKRRQKYEGSEQEPRRRQDRSEDNRRRQRNSIEESPVRRQESIVDNRRHYDEREERQRRFQDEPYRDEPSSQELDKETDDIFRESFIDEPVARVKVSAAPKRKQSFDQNPAFTFNPQTIQEVLDDSMTYPEEPEPPIQDPSLKSESVFDFESKFIFIPSLLAQDSIHQKIEKLRAYTETIMGRENAILAYRYLKSMDENTDPARYTDMMRKKLGDNISFLFILHHLIVCEEVAMERIHN